MYDLCVDITNDLYVDIAYDLCMGTRLFCQGIHRSCSQALWLPDLLIIRCPDEYPDQDLNGIPHHASLRGHLGVHNQAILMVVIASKDIHDQTCCCVFVTATHQV